MTRMKRNDPHYSIETGGNPLSNPYASFPAEEPTQENKESEALELAQSLMRDLSLTKGIDSDFEIKEALCQDEVINSFINAFHVYRNTKDCTKCASIWFDTLQGFMQQFEKALSHQMRFYIENPK